MSGIRFLFISKDNKVFRTSQPKNLVYKPILELAEQEVFEVILYYETKERKPNKLLTVWFNRLKLDSAGGHVVSDDTRKRAFFNYSVYGGFVTAEELANSDQPLAIPVAPVIPTVKEKEALYAYLKDKSPPLFKDAPFIVEKRITALKVTHQNNIDLMKRASKLK